MTVITKEGFALLAELEENNNKAWYEANKKLLKVIVRDPFADILEDTTKRLEKTKVPLIGHAKTMFR